MNEPLTLKRRLAFILFFGLVAMPFLAAGYLFQVASIGFRFGSAHARDLFLDNMADRKADQPSTEQTP